MGFCCHPNVPDRFHPHSEAFDLFDTDGSGTIDAKELKVAMRYAMVDDHTHVIAYTTRMPTTHPTTHTQCIGI